MYVACHLCLVDLRWSLSHQNCVDGGQVACVERIKDVTNKGHKDHEIIFVSMKGRIARCEEGEDGEEIRRQLPEDQHTGVIKIIRNTVFMKESTGEKEEPKAVKCKQYQSSTDPSLH